MIYTYIAVAAASSLVVFCSTTIYNSKKRIRLLKAQKNDYENKLSSVNEEKSNVENEFEDLKNLAYYDNMTGLPNSMKFATDLKNELADNPEANYALMVFNLCNLNRINVMYGLEESDKVKRFVADTLIDKLGNSYIYGCINDELYAIVSSCDEEDEPTGLAEILSEYLTNYSSNISLELQFGIYKIVNRDMDVDQMINLAELSKRTIKPNDEVNYAFYTKELDDRLREDKQMGAEMDYALAHRQFVTFLQPMVNLRNHQIISAEALVRWDHPEKGILSPYRFMPLFETNNFIIKLDHYVWEDSCKTIRHWIDNNIDPIPVSINISPIHFSHPGFVDKLIALTNQYRINPKYIQLEFPERAFSDTTAEIKTAINRLSEAGFPICIDNFGSYHSPVNLLRDLPIDMIKLDRKFLNDSIPTETGLTLVRYVIAMVKELDKDIIAEGVETNDQANNLLEIGCDNAQGFFFAKPIPLREFDELRAKVLNSNYTPSVIYPSISDSPEALLP